MTTDFSIAADGTVYSKAGNKLLDGEIIVMQSTGLKDKNGKEIFEGDIVAVPYITPLGELGGVEDKDARSAVGFEHGQFVLLRKPQSQSIVAWCRKEEGEYVSNFGNLKVLYDQTELEIIGNIHENPELLPASS